MATPQDDKDDWHHLFAQAEQDVAAVFNRLQDHLGQRLASSQTLRSAILQHEKIEQELKAANEAAQAATRLKDQFVSLVAHDLKSPLGAMLGMLELIDSDISHPIHGEHKELLHLAMRSGQNMVKLIKNLLDISRLQSGKITLDPQFMDAHVLVKEVLARVSHHAERKGVVLRNTIPQHSRLRGDRHLLAEVVQNLVTNAVKFSHGGQEVVIEWREDKENNQVLLQVRDQGVGISAERLDKLFRIEEKCSTVGTAGEEGTGFGLPFSRDIMLAHQGDLVVTSQMQQGSCFTIQLPNVRPRVVLVDDLRTARLMFRSILSPLNVEVEEAGHGREALTLMQDFQPHLVISDIIMPEMDGFELLAAIRANPALANTNVIMVTTDENIETRELAFSLGAEDFVTKPVIMCDFIPRIRRLVG